MFSSSLHTRPPPSPTLRSRHQSRKIKSSLEAPGENYICKGQNLYLLKYVIYICICSRKSSVYTYITRIYIHREVRIIPSVYTGLVWGELIYEYYGRMNPFTNISGAIYSLTQHQAPPIFIYMKPSFGGCRMRKGREREGSMYSRAFKENNYKNNDRVKKSPKNVCHAAGVTDLWTGRGS